MDTTNTPPSQQGPGAPDPAERPGPGVPPFQPYAPPYGSAYPPSGSAPRPPGGASSMDGFFSSVRRWGVVRTDERWVGGVCGGLARAWNVDVALVRGVAVVTALITGIGLLAYGAAWLLLPEESDGRSHLQELLSGRFDIAAAGGVAMIVLGATWDGPWNWFTPWGDVINVVAWITAIIIAIAMVVATLGNRDGRPRPGPGPVPPPAPFVPAPPSASHSDPSTPAPGSTVPGAPTPAPAAPSTPPTAVYPAVAYGAPTAPATAYAPPRAAPPIGQYAAPAPGTYGAPRPAWTPPPPKPRGPIVKGAGPVTVSIVLGVSAIVAAVLLALSRTGDFTGPVLLTSLGVLVGLCGLATMVSGIRGRSTGALGGIAIVALLAAGPTAVWSSLELDVNDAQGIVLGDENYTPTSAASAQKGFAMGMGSWVVDLTDVPLTAGTELKVPVSFTAGDLTVYVPEGTAWTAGVTLNAGSIKVVDGDRTRSADGVGTTEREFASVAVEGGSAPTLNLAVHAGLGDITIEEQ